MARKRGLTPEEIANLLRELSENESEGGDISDSDEDLECVNLDCENDFSSDSDTDENEESKSNNTNVNEFEDDTNANNSDGSSCNAEIFVAPDGTQWKMSENKNNSGRHPKQNILRQESGPTNHAKRNVTEDSVLSAWLLFIDSKILLHIKKMY